MPVAAFAQPVTIMNMRMQPSATSSRFVFGLSEKTPVKVIYQTNPYRVIVTFSNVKRHFSMHNAKLGGANVKIIDSLNDRDGKITFIFETNSKPAWKTRFVKAKTGKSADFELIINTPAAIPATAKTPVVFVHPDSIRHELLQSIISVTKKIVQKTRVDRKLVVVIDPGHGGRDSGAVGKNGVEEKTIVLSIAKKLQRDINQSARMHAVMTRSTDEYVSLRDRLAIARKNHADVFIAIHADSFMHDRAAGASIYALSPQGATSEAARWLAQQENHSELGQVELNELSDKSEMLRSIMIDLAQTATIKDSLQLGAHIMNVLDEFSKMHRKQVEQAPFVVLKSPDIPSILVETGFITNRSEEQRLVNESYQQKTADAICHGINSYFQSRYYLTMSHARAKDSMKQDA
jgi:N-acetylmuramoyl-L-alanine amidase